MADSAGHAESPPEVPADINFDCELIEVACHPTKDVIACGQIDGDISLFSYSCSESNHLLTNFTHHRKPIRAVKFSHDGERLITTSKDKSIQVIDLNNGKIVHNYKKAHKSPPYSMLIIDEFKLATGDDDGHLKIWDFRQPEPIMEIKQCEEFISDMCIDKDKKILAATSGEGTLTAFNIKRKRMEMQSELMDSELLCLAPLKNGSKLVCGSGDGVLSIFNWGEWGNISDRMPGPSVSIDCMIPISQNIICTGADDGVIRAISILPNREIGVVGDHGEFPITKLSVSHDKTYLVSCSHDQKVKFWDINCIKNEKINTYRNKFKKKQQSKLLNTSAKTQSGNFFSDFNSEPPVPAPNEDDSDSDSDGDSDEDSSVVGDEEVKGDGDVESSEDDIDDSDDESDDDESGDEDKGEKDESNKDES